MKKLKFIKQDQHKKARLKAKWKRPRGLHSKMRLKKRGYRCCVDTGYKTARSKRGMHKSGLRIVTVRSLADLKKLDREKELVIISKIGLKKRLELIKEAKKEGLRVLNIDVDKFLKGVEELFKKKKEEKVAKKKEKVKKKEEKEKVAKEKEKTLEKEVEKSEEELKEEEKRERDKILTKKEE